MSLFENISPAYPVVPFGPFIDDAVAASQSNAQLTLAGVSNDGVVMPADGHVIGVLWTLTAAASAGQMTLGVSIDGTEDAETTETVTTQTEGYTLFNIHNGEAPHFVAGQQIGVEITTDASWNATTADLAAFLLVEFGPVA